MKKHRKSPKIYDEALTYENLYAAWNTVLHTCKNKHGLFEFAMYGHARVSRLLNELKARKYYPNKFRCFMIFEPKPRLVMSQSIRDKVVNHFVAKRYLIPLLENTLVDTNVATRLKLGASYATKKMKQYFARIFAENPEAKIYALKIDISKYFYSIDHEILFEKLRRRVKDKDVLEILRRIIDETNKPYINNVIDKFNQCYHTNIPHYGKGRGLSIGAMASQFLAIFYLDEVDHYIKEGLKCVYYIRYMDDFILLGTDKKQLYEWMRKIEVKIVEHKLKMNPKSAIYNCSSKTGFSFLGYRYYLERTRKGNQVLRIVCMSRTVRRVKKRLRLLKEHDFEKYERSRESYRGYFEYESPASGGWSIDKVPDMMK